MKALTNSALKLLAAAQILLVACSASANGYKYTYSQYGQGATKGEAVASTLQHLPYGAKIQKIGFNGYSTKEFVPGVGYIQTSGNYKCRIDYSNNY
jgi:roadblock/LC7 domain-containing protein